MPRETLTIGPAPAEEPCAQLGITDLFEQANLLEQIRCYRAALTACHGAPPVGAAFHVERNIHDFGTYSELAVRYDPDDEMAGAWAYAVEEGLARWLDADFAAHMQRWTARQFERRATAMPAQTSLFLDVADPLPSDPWEQAWATAQEEIRTLIAAREIAHDQITTGWVAEWAAASICP